jgi:hypothetical protein
MDRISKLGVLVPPARYLAAPLMAPLQVSTKYRSGILFTYWIISTRRRLALGHFYSTSLAYASWTVLGCSTRNLQPFKLPLLPGAGGVLYWAGLP